MATLAGCGTPTLPELKRMCDSGKAGGCEMLVDFCDGRLYPQSGPFPDCCSAYADHLRATRQDDKAIEYYGKACAKNAWYCDATEQGAAQLVESDPARAARYYAMVCDHGWSSACEALGKLELKAGRLEAAAKSFEKGCGQTPSYAWVPGTHTAWGIERVDAALFNHAQGKCCYALAELHLAKSPPDRDHAMIALQKAQDAEAAARQDTDAFRQDRRDWIAAKEKASAEEEQRNKEMLQRIQSQLKKK